LSRELERLDVSSAHVKQETTDGLSADDDNRVGSAREAESSAHHVEQIVGCGLAGMVGNEDGDAECGLRVDALGLLSDPVGVLRRTSMEMLDDQQSVPDVSAEQRAANELIKLVRKLCWAGMGE